MYLCASDDWREPSARKAFFENYAKQKEFDPLNPENWYLQTYDNIMSARVRDSYVVKSYVP